LLILGKYLKFHLLFYSFCVKIYFAKELIIINRLKELREAKKLNMREVAKKLNIPYTTYVNYEKGLREPNSEMLILLANFYGVTLDYLIGREKQETLINKDDEECPEEISYAIEHLTELELDPITGAQIRTQRENKGITCAELSTDLNNLYHTKFSELKVKQWEAGFPAPTKSEKIILSKYFGFPIGFIDDNELLSFALYGKDNKEITPEILSEIRRYAQYLKDKKRKGI